MTGQLQDPVVLQLERVIGSHHTAGCMGPKTIWQRWRSHFPCRQWQHKRHFQYCYIEICEKCRDKGTYIECKIRVSCISTNFVQTNFPAFVPINRLSASYEVHTGAPCIRAPYLHVEFAFVLSSFNQGSDVLTNVSRTSEYQISFKCVQSFSGCYMRKKRQTRMSHLLYELLQILLRELQTIVKKSCIVCTHFRTESVLLSAEMREINYCILNHVYRKKNSNNSIMSE